MSIFQKRERHPLSLTEGSVPKMLIRFTLPFFISSVFQVLYGAADVAFMGRFSTAGVSIRSASCPMVTVPPTSLSLMLRSTSQAVTMGCSL